MKFTLQAAALQNERYDVNGKRREILAKVEGAIHAPDLREVGHGGLQQKIRDYCDRQWPRWKYINARSDQPSGIAVGAQDFTIFASGGRVFCIEVKAKGGKLSDAQRDWKHTMGLVGQTVHEVTSMAQFEEIVR